MSVPSLMCKRPLALCRGKLARDSFLWYEKGNLKTKPSRKFKNLPGNREKRLDEIKIRIKSFEKVIVFLCFSYWTISPTHRYQISSPLPVMICLYWYFNNVLFRALVKLQLAGIAAAIWCSTLVIFVLFNVVRS